MFCPGYVAIAPGLSLRCGFAIVSLLQLGAERGVRAHSAWLGVTLYFARILKINNKQHVSVINKPPGEDSGQMEDG
jgi:hypothetical protein